LRGRRRVTRYHYNDTGQISHTTEDPAWTDADFAIMQAYAAYQATLCPDCASEVALAWSEEAEGWFEVEDVDCASCGARIDHVKAHKNFDRRTKLYVRNMMPEEMIARLRAEAQREG
jgi:hypothetical protein